MEESSDTDVRKLVERARNARKNAYCPYSNFPVGAALLCEDGSIFEGCNVENAAYGETVCAERTAIFSAVAAGKRKFKTMAVVGKEKGGAGKLIACCGTCRQVFVEFGMDWEIVITQSDDTFKRFKVSELVPYAFDPEALKQGVGK